MQVGKGRQPVGAGGQGSSQKPLQGGLAEDLQGEG